MWSTWKKFFHLASNNSVIWTVKILLVSIIGYFKLLIAVLTMDSKCSVAWQTGEMGLTAAGCSVTTVGYHIFLIVVTMMIVITQQVFEHNLVTDGGLEFHKRDNHTTVRVYEEDALRLLDNLPAILPLTIGILFLDPNKSKVHLYCFKTWVRGKKLLKIMMNLMCMISVLDLIKTSWSMVVFCKKPIGSNFF